MYITNVRTYTSHNFKVSDDKEPVRCIVIVIDPQPDPVDIELIESEIAQDIKRVLTSKCYGCDS